MKRHATNILFIAALGIIALAVGVFLYSILTMN